MRFHQSSEYNRAMQEDTPKRRMEKVRREFSRRRRDTLIQLGESLLRSRRVELPTTIPDRERLAQIEAYKDLIRSEEREIEEWRQYRDSAAKLGNVKTVQFREQMIAGMEGQLARYKEELRQLQSMPGSFWTGST
jgi:hypothetical protein